MKKSFYLIILTVLSISLSSCFKDLGNYDYIDINEVIISDVGFSKPYDCRIKADRIKINPELTFTQDPEEKGNYSYEWVAVGQNIQRGERFIIGTERNLDYLADLKEDKYILYLKVKDLSTDLVFSKGVEMNLRSNYSMGWLLGGEDNSGNGTLDMISISNNILCIHNTLVLEEGLKLSPVTIVWVDNDEWTSDGRLYVGTDDGTWKFDRVNFNGSPYTHLKYSFAISPDNQTCRMTDCMKIADKRHIIIVDDMAYNVSSSGGMIENSFSYWENDIEKRHFKIAPYMMYNRRMKDIRCFVFYNDIDKEFCFISGLSITGMKRLGDKLEDTYSWKTTEDHEGGLSMIATVNSFFGNGQAIAIMESQSGERYIFCLTPDNTGSVNKEGKYKISSEANDFDRAEHFIITTNHGYLIYSVDNRLYGLNFRKTPMDCVLLEEFDAPITMIKADNDSEEKYDDNFYVATYDDSRDRSGIMYKYHVVDSPNKIELTHEGKWDEGFLKINTMCWKAF